MASAMKSLRAAACHVSPVFLSARNTTEKCIKLISESSRQGADLVIFPETFIPAFPVWSALRAPTENHDLFKRMVRESIYADGEEMSAICAAAKQADIMVSVGISEKARYSSGTLWNSNMFVGRNGKVLNHHRKLMPTFFEKLTWSPGDGHGLNVVDTHCGKIGNLICGENTNPLARYALIAQGEQVHISSWPAMWPTRALEALEDDVADVTKRPDSRTTRNYDNVAANRVRAAAHCFEGKCFGILNSGFLDDEAIDIIAGGASNEASVRRTLKESQRGATMFLDPTGALLPGTTDPTAASRKEIDWLQNEEGVLYADLHLDECVEGKQYHDVVGGYQRFDVFKLQVNRGRQRPVVFSDSLEGNIVTEREQAESKPIE